MRLLRNILFAITLMAVLCSSIQVCDALHVKSEQLQQRPFRLDVCEPNARAYDPKIVCYCTTLDSGEYKKADCWVYGSELSEDDVAWDGFGRSANIKELSFVVFSNSRLGFLPQKGMYYLTDMTKFSLSYADIPTMSSYAFSKLEKLQEISLVNNNISTLEDYAFSKLENLRSLNLSFNQITDIERHVFYKNYKLELLHMTVNNITTIADKAFADLNHLIELRLDYNMIYRITGGTLVGLSSLILLTLTGNSIASLDEDTLEHVPALEHLDLSQNAIQWIAPEAFKWNHQLRYINLEQNELKQVLDANLFYSMTTLSYLNLAKNFLTTFEVDKDRLMVDRFLNESSIFYLNDNNLVCDCRLLWLFEVRNRSRSGVIQKSLDNLNCDLQEGDQKPEHVYLLRLHHENFECQSTVLSGSIQSRPEIHEKHIPRTTSNGNSLWGSGISLIVVQAAVVKLLMCYVYN